MDREKVIKETEDGIAFAESRGFGGLANTMRNALALLKEQDDLGTELTNAVELIRKKNERIEKLLKEQEAKTGYWIDSAGNDKCSICGTEYSDLYPDYGNTHFCPNCGAKMKGR